jgi:hypothetical protein
LIKRKLGEFYGSVCWRLTKKNPEFQPGLPFLLTSTEFVIYIRDQPFPFQKIGFIRTEKSFSSTGLRINTGVFRRRAIDEKD